MTYRILLVTADAAAGSDFQAVMNQSGNGCFVVECLDRLDDAVARAQAGGLDIVLFEQSLHSINALTTLEQLSRIATAVPLMLYRALGDSRDSPTTQSPCAPIPSNQLAHEHAHAQAILDSISAAVITTDLLGHVDYLNRAAQRISGWTLEQARGHSIGEVMPPPDGHSSRCTAKVPQILRENRPKFPIKGRRAPRAFEDSSAPIHNGDGQISGAVVVFHDVSAAQAMADKMTHLAQHDILTHLPNRLLLDDRIAQAIHLAKRHAGSLALMFLDLDNFKQINDSLGHAVGDQLLQSISRRLLACVRGSDTVSRTGGDEFIVLLSEIQDERDAAVSARKILDALGAQHCIEQLEVQITCSIGISLFPGDGSSAGALLRHADSAMYQAKQAGRNRYRFFQDHVEVHADGSP
ncbi:diguanylate cyclase [Ectopseudomonas composti]